jgi:hypothetical protein
VHTYENAGLFTVKVEINADGEIRSREKPYYIKALADSLLPASGEGGRNATVEIPVYAHNFVPITTIKIPVEYSGDLDVTLDSFSTVGCRTEYFEQQSYLHFNPAGKQKTIKLVSSYSGTSPDLPAGEGVIANLYFTISGSAEYEETTFVEVDGYNDYSPMFGGHFATYTPRVTTGTLSVCAMRGDLDGSLSINMSDLMYLVDYLFNGGPAPSPLEAGDVNCQGGVNIIDLTYLIEYLFFSGPPPCGC